MRILRRRRRATTAPPEVGGATDVGRRDENQDRWAAGPGWAVVCDGVGGHAGGAAAAATALDAVRAVLTATDLDRLDEAGARAVLTEAASAANAAVLTGRAQAPEQADMATTLTAAVALADRRRWVVVQVGDSPAWSVGPETARSITWDHNLVGDLVRTGVLRPEEAAGHRGRHVITRAIGIAAAVDPELFTVAVAPGEALVLASDGLSDVAEPAAAVPVVADAADARSAAEDLVALALARGTADNVTVVVVR